MKLFVRILALIDAFALIVLLLLSFGIKNHTLIFVAIFLLAIKSLPFLFSNFCIACAIDIFTVFVLIFANYSQLPLPIILFTIFAIGQKTFFSLV